VRLRQLTARLAFKLRHNLAKGDSGQSEWRIDQSIVAVLG
jgi:hypothetical protein